MDIVAAKKLFFDHDGSQFYMSRNGVESAYHAAEVDGDSEAGWLKKLTRQKLQLLPLPGNFRTIVFLEHHRDHSHLRTLLAVEPKGILGERCAFVEHLMSYAISGRTACDHALIRDVIARIISLATDLLIRSRSPESRKRVQRCLDSARRAQQIG